MQQFKQDKAETICTALLLKDAGRGQFGSRVFVTVNGHVTFGSGVDPRTGVQFTHEEWQQVVLFVESQLFMQETEAEES